jgi:endonuclease/exonuclease/phosphatase family metal-dependent hydrolase
MPWTIATYNVMNLLEPKDDAARAILPLKIAALARALVECDADVVALQEIGNTALVRAVLAAMPRGLGDRYGEPVMGTTDGRGIGCAIASRLPVLDARVHTADALAFPAFAAGDPPPFGSRIPLRRGVVHVVVGVPGSESGPVHVFAAHFKSRIGVPLRNAAGDELPATTARARAEATLRSFVWRAAEALYVRGLVDDALSGAPSAGAVVAGDLNDLADSPVLDALRGGGAGELFDCTAGIPSEARFSVLHAGRGVQIDHALASANLFARILRARFLNAGVRDHGPFVPGAPEALSVDSDHAPLVVQFA